MLDKNVLQFALLPVKRNDGREVSPIVAAGEFQYLEDFGGGEIAVAPKNEDGYELSICYGRYLLSIKESPNGEPITKQELHDQVQHELDKWMIGISENQTYFMGIKDIVIIDSPLERKCCHGHSSCNSNHGTNSDQVNDFAFAVLVSSNAKLKEITDTVIYDESNAVDRLEKFKVRNFNVFTEALRTIKYLNSLCLFY